MDVGRVEANPRARNVEVHHKGATERFSPWERVERLEEIRSYLRDLESSREIVATTTTNSGQTIDWIPVESQTSDGAIAEPPDLAADAGRGGGAPSSRLDTAVGVFELEAQPWARGPSGTVPVLRRNIAEFRPVGDLTSFLSKYGHPARLEKLSDGKVMARPLDDSVHKYAAVFLSSTSYGGQGDLNLWNPYLEQSDEMSLAQAACHGTTADKLMQTVEAGWQVNPNLYGDWNTHFFVFYTTNGYEQEGNRLGGYNQDVTGWVQYSSTIHPGAVWNTTSVFGGPQYYATFRVCLSQGNWWVAINGNWIGYYPASLFATPGLRANAEGMNWFGEIAQAADNPHPTTATGMGSDFFPDPQVNQNGYVAYIDHLLMQTNAAGSFEGYGSGISWASHPACYQIDAHLDNKDSAGSFFWYGGPGRNPYCP